MTWPVTIFLALQTIVPPTTPPAPLIDWASLRHDAPALALIGAVAGAVLAFVGAVTAALIAAGSTYIAGRVKANADRRLALEAAEREWRKEQLTPFIQTVSVYCVHIYNLGNLVERCYLGLAVAGNDRMVSRASYAVDSLALNLHVDWFRATDLVHDYNTKAEAFLLWATDALTVASEAQASNAKWIAGPEQLEACRAARLRLSSDAMRAGETLRREAYAAIFNVR